MGKSASAFCLTELCSRALTGVTSSAKCVVLFLFNFLRFHRVDVAENSTTDWSTLWCIFLCVSSTSCEGIWILVFLKLVILLSALPYLPVERAEQVFTAAVCHSRQANNSAKHTVLCGRPHHYTRHEFLSYDSNVTSRLRPQLCLWLKDLGIVRNVPKKPRWSKRGGGRKQRQICVIVGVH